jgi:hypothetical protein
MCSLLAQPIITLLLGILDSPAHDGSQQPLVRVKVTTV